MRLVSASNYFSLLPGIKVIGGEVIGRYVPTTVLQSSPGDKQWFDASCRRASDAKQTAYRAWCRACNVEHCG